MSPRRLASVLLLLLVSVPALAQDGQALYTEHCASCHAGGADRAPSLQQLRAMPPGRILEVLEFGSMVSMTHGRTTAERRAMAEFASGRSLGTPFTIAPLPKAMCPSPSPTFTMGPAAPVWNGFGQNLSNTRFQDASAAGIAAEDAPRLRLKWAFGLPGDVQSWAAITLAGGRAFVGSIAGNVYSLDVRTGCVHWAFDAGTIVRTAVSVGRLGTTEPARYGAFFGDARGNAYAVDAATGSRNWARRRAISARRTSRSA
jgi:polyvinyl alcohol dehydrogenase (cytochrome)